MSARTPLLQRANNKVASCTTTAVLLAGLPLFTLAATMPPTFNFSELDGENGFIVRGIDDRDTAGNSVSNAGDVNGDGVDDLIIGASGADPFGNSGAGESYVLFGGSSVINAPSFHPSTLDGSNGFIINGSDAFDFSGISVSAAGDINDDSIDDLIVGAFLADTDDLAFFPGESYVVYMPLPDNLDSGLESDQLLPGQTRFLSIHPGDPSDRLEISLPVESIVSFETANDGTTLDQDTQLVLFEGLGFSLRVFGISTDIEPGVNLYSRITRSLPAGDYQIRATAQASPNGPVTIPSYALSYSILNPCDVSDPALLKTLGNGDFELLSLPCQPPEGTTINDLFNDDIDGEYFDGTSGTWVVFTWDPETRNYVNPGPNGTLEPGQGFWITQVQANGQDAVLDLPEGSFTTRSTGVVKDACASNNGCLSIELSDSDFPINPNTNAPVLTMPNLIGNPYDQPVTPFDDVQITTTNGACSIAGGGCSPTEATLPADGGANELGNVAFAFNPQLRGGLGDYESVVSGSVLEPWQGFWVFQLPAGIDNNPVVRFPDLR